MLSASVNGVELAYERRGKGTPLVLVHGYPLEHTIWEDVAARLEGEAELVLPDLRGFGRSQIVSTPYDLSDMAADIAALLDILGVNQAVIVGHSMGGYVALAFAGMHPERVLGLGLVASQAAADAPDRRQERYTLAEKVEKEGAGTVAESMPLKLTNDPQLQVKLKELIRGQSPAGIAGALRAMAEREDFTPRLAEFNFPILCVHGLADGIVPVERVHEIQAGARSCEVVLLEDAGHMLMMESPKKTADALRKLL